MPSKQNATVEELIMKENINGVIHYMAKMKECRSKKMRIEWLPSWKTPLSLRRKLDKEIRDYESGLRKKRVDCRNQRKNKMDTL